MTLVSEIIKDAYRQSNILAIGVEPTAPQKEEALRYLNRIVTSVFGNEAGEQLQPFPIGRNNIDSPAGFPWYNEAPGGDWFLPKNQRLMLNLGATVTIPLHPMPDDGSRLGVLDVTGNLSTYHVVLEGNGRNIEGSPTLTLSANGTNQEWFYRQDLGNWVKTTALLLTDPFPFPLEFDQMFITMLALTVNPAYAVSVDQQTMLMFKRTKGQFQARYQQHIQVGSEDGLIRLPYQTADRRYYYGWGDTTALFDKGYPW